MTSPDRTPGFRVLVTGSREVRDSDAPAIEQALLTAVGDAAGWHTLTHGGARGADKLAAGVATRLGWLVKRRRAFWSAACVPECTHGPRAKNPSGPGDICQDAGKHRNSRMVREGHDVAVAVFATWARNGGTADCVKKIRAAGIRLLLVHVERDGSWRMAWSPAADAPEQAEQLELGTAS